MNLSSPKTYLSLTAESSPPPVSRLVRGYFSESKNTRSRFHHKVVFLAPAVYYKKKEGVMEIPALFVIFCLPCITGYEFASGFLDCFAEHWNTSMTWMRNVFYSLALKRASLMKKCVTLVYFTLAGSLRRHLSPVSCVDKVSLFIQSGKDKPWMKHCGAKKGRERKWEMMGKKEEHK